MIKGLNMLPKARWVSISLAAAFEFTAIRLCVEMSSVVLESITGVAVSFCAARKIAPVKRKVLN